MRRQLLESRGWTVLSIPHFEWAACQGQPDKQQQYLRQLLLGHVEVTLPAVLQRACSQMDDPAAAALMQSRRSTSVEPPPQGTLSAEPSWQSDGALVVGAPGSSRSAGEPSRCENDQGLEVSKQPVDVPVFNHCPHPSLDADHHQADSSVPCAG